jgi:Cellulase (glycosyl hydrolase family 5)
MFTMKPWGFLGTMLTLFCIIETANCAEDKLSGTPQPVAATYFGMHMHRVVNPGSPTNTTPWPDVKFGSWRLWDANVAWPNLEPKKGEWDFTQLDKYVEMAGQHNVEILLPLGLSPQWASARPNEKSAYSPGNSAEPQNIDDWRNYVRMVATRYKGKIHHYELWNEVNLPMFYTGSQQQLVDMAREMYSIIKKVDSTNVVVSPSITGNYGKDWLNKYFQVGGGNYADVIGYHFYVPTKAPEAIPSFVHDIKAIMAKNGLANKPLWNTETGWRMANSDGTPDTGVGTPSTWKRLLPDEAASYVARALILGKVSGIDRFYWYAWDNAYMGLIEPKSKMAKPAGRAYGQVYDWLVGGVLQDCTQTEQLWTCDLLDAKGGHSHLLWTTGQDTAWTAPNSWNVTSYQTLDGQQHTLKSGTSIILTQAPMRIVGRISP